jgi:hypothetical protein
MEQEIIFPSLPFPSLPFPSPPFPSLPFEGSLFFSHTSIFTHDNTTARQSVMSFATKILMKQLKELQQHPVLGVHACPLETNLFEWHGNVFFPEDHEYFRSLCLHFRMYFDPEVTFVLPCLVFPVFLDLMSCNVCPEMLIVFCLIYSLASFCLIHNRPTRQHRPASVLHRRLSIHMCTTKLSASVLFLISKTSLKVCVFVIYLCHLSHGLRRSLSLFLSLYRY